MGNNHNQPFIEQFFRYIAKGISSIFTNDNSSSTLKQEIEELVRDNERYQKRIKEMEEQIDKLKAAAERHREEEKEDSDEIEDLEDELKAAKNKIKVLQTLNTQYESEIRDLRDSNESLKAELEEANGDN